MMWKYRPQISVKATEKLNSKDGHLEGTDTAQAISERTVQELVRRGKTRKLIVSPLSVILYQLRQSFQNQIFILNRFSVRELDAAM